MHVRDIKRCFWRRHQMTDAWIALLIHFLLLVEVSMIRTIQYDFCLTMTYACHWIGFRWMEFERFLLLIAVLFFTVCVIFVHDKVRITLLSLCWACLLMWFSFTVEMLKQSLAKFAYCDLKLNVLNLAFCLKYNSINMKITILSIITFNWLS